MEPTSEHTEATLPPRRLAPAALQAIAPAETPQEIQAAAGVDDEEATAREAPLVSVVIPCYNHAHFLGEAIESVLAQTYQFVETIVVDDGSTDATPNVAACYPDVRYVRQENQGLAAARNTGIYESTGRYLVFLDADDRLLPAALDAGLDCFQAHPACGFVFGAFRWIASDGSVLGRADASQHSGDQRNKDPYLAMLRSNYISMHGTVMYRRDVLASVRGFDPSLAACEDYDLYLRVARCFPVHGHDTVVAEYRMHSANMSDNAELVLKSALMALRSQWKHVKADARYREAYDQGVSLWVETYGQELLWPAAHLRVQSKQEAVRGAAVLLRYVPRWFAKQIAMQLFRAGFRVLKPVLPASIRRRLQARWPALSRRLPPSVGRVRFGDLRRLAPLDRHFGYERGLPVDRYYIERFLTRHAQDIRGHVLEIKDNDYTRRFGGDQVARSSVLDVDEGNPAATIVDDLTEGNQIPSETFDCVILTQTLQLIYNVRAALATSYRILKPGGVVLASVPGITKIDQGNPWYWSFTARSAQRLFEEVFPASEVAVEAHGNVLAAQSFLQGLASKELRPEELDCRDLDYPVAIVVRAVKPEDAS